MSPQSIYSTINICLCADGLKMFLVKTGFMIRIGMNDKKISFPFLIFNCNYL